MKKGWEENKLSYKLGQLKIELILAGSQLSQNMGHLKIGSRADILKTIGDFI